LRDFAERNVVALADDAPALVSKLRQRSAKIWHIESQIFAATKMRASFHQVYVARSSRSAAGVDRCVGDTHS
jgi:hypothetical protein